MAREKGEKIYKRITSEAIRILQSNPNGVRFLELTVQIKAKYPDIKPATLEYTVSHLDQINPQEIYKPARGLFQLIKFRDEEIKEETESEKTPGEEDFYQPFAEWLVNELGECERAIPLGKKVFGDKWTTPDVIGIRESERDALIKLPTEIISAEIKTEKAEVITAFGQACAYHLFSHNVYLVIPNESKPTDIARLDSLCRILGIGLILFDNKNFKKPEFEIRARSVKHDPDMFYANQYLKTIKKELFH